MNGSNDCTCWKSVCAAASLFTDLARYRSCPDWISRERSIEDRMRASDEWHLLSWSRYSEENRSGASLTFGWEIMIFYRLLSCLALSYILAEILGVSLSDCSARNGSSSVLLILSSKLLYFSSFSWSANSCDSVSHMFERFGCVIISPDPLSMMLDCCRNWNNWGCVYVELIFTHGYYAKVFAGKHVSKSPRKPHVYSLTYRIYCFPRWVKWILFEK